MADSSKERSIAIRVIEAGHSKHTNDKKMDKAKMKSVERRNKTGLYFLK